MTRLGICRRRRLLGFSLIEFLIAAGITTFLAAVVVWGFYKTRREVSIENQRNELFSLQKSIIFILTQDLSASLRVTGFGRTTTPGLSRFPDSPRSNDENDGVTLLVREFSNFPIPVEYDTATRDRITFVNSQDADVNRLVGLYHRAAEVYNLFAILNPINQSVIKKSMIQDESFRTHILFDLANPQETPEFSGRQNLMLPLKIVTWVVEGDRLYRKAKLDPAGPYTESRMVASGVKQFKVDYDFVDLDQTAGQTVDLPTGRLSHISEHTCNSSAPNTRCHNWDNVSRAYLTMKLQGAKEVPLREDILLGGQTSNIEGISVKDSHLIYTTSNVPLFPYGYLGFGSTQQMLQGVDVRCSIDNPTSARCNPICAGADGPFHGTARFAPDWEDFGRPLFNRDGTENPNVSEVCRCGTNPVTRTYIAANTLAGHSDSQLPNWNPNNTELNRRWEACAGVYDGCEELWMNGKYPPAPFACWCAQGMGDYYDRSVFPAQIHLSAMQALASSTLADNPHRSCSLWSQCDVLAGALGAAGGSRYFRNQCRCLTHNRGVFGNVQMDTVISPVYHLSMYDICSLASDPNNSSDYSYCPNGASGGNCNNPWPPQNPPEGVCPDSWDVRNSGTGAVGHYILADPEHTPAFRAQGINENTAMMCQCLRDSLQNNRAGLKNSSGVFEPPNGVVVTAWDFREANLPLRTDLFPGLVQNQNFTAGSNSNRIIPGMEVYYYDNSGTLLSRPLSNLPDGRIDCSLAHFRAANPLWEANFANCNFRVNGIVEAQIPVDLRPWSGYCRSPNNFQYLRPEDRYPGYESFTTACGMVHNASTWASTAAFETELANIDVIRHALSSTPIGSTLPGWCGGPSNPGSGGSYQP